MVIRLIYPPHLFHSLKKENQFPKGYTLILQVCPLFQFSSF